MGLFKKSVEKLLIIAAERGNLSEAKEAIEKGADINAEGRYGTALMRATLNGHLDIVKLLIEKGANIDEKNKHLDGETALMRACALGHIDVVKLLIEKGADINAKDNNGETVLKKTPNLLDIAKLLIEKGADVNAKDNNGNTALMDGVVNSWKKKAIFLVKKDADVDIKNNRGESVLTLIFEHLTLFPADMELAHLAGLVLRAVADINEKDNSGRTLLDRAIGNSTCHIDDDLFIVALKAVGAKRGDEC